MARGRAKDILEENKPEEAVFNEEQQAEATEEVKHEAEEAPKQENAENKAEATSAEIPANVIQLLRIFNAYDELYITPWGGVFTSPQAHVKDAVLYKNPFFKK